MRSFSSFKPVHDGTPTEIKTKTFAMWLRANAMNIRSPFSRTTWRTARPWLSFNDVRYQLKMFRDRTLGSIVISGIELTDKDVEKAVKFEAYATRQVCSQDVKEMILNFYDYSRIIRVNKKDVLEKINQEFAYLDRGYVTSRDRSWKQAMETLSEIGKCTLKPKISEHKVADLIMELYDPGNEEVTVEEVYYSILPFLNKMGESLHRSSPILRRALSITGVQLSFKNHRRMIEDTIKKYYVAHELCKEPLQRLQAVVNLKYNIPRKNKIWDVIDLRIVPRHDFTSNEYEICLDKKYHDPPIITRLQEPFMKYIMPYQYVRKKQKIPWRWLFTLCERTGGTTEETLKIINRIIEKNGLIPYHHAHPEFDRLKIQGLTIQNVSYASLEQTQVRFPPVLKRKRQSVEPRALSDNEDSQHSGE